MYGKSEIIRHGNNAGGKGVGDGSAPQGSACTGREAPQEKALNDILDAILAMKCDTSALTDDYITETAQKLAAEKGESITLYEAIALSQIKRAIDGDTKAATFVRDSAGDKPLDRSEVTNMETITDADRRMMENISKRLGIE